MVKTQKSRSSKSQTTEFPNQDAIGLGLLLLGIACLFSLVWKSEALLPKYLNMLLRLFAGSGAYIVPAIFLFFGVMVLRRFNALSPNRATIGSILLFLLFVAWRHILLVPHANQWDNAEIMGAGGWLGALLGASLISVLGTFLSHCLLLTGATLCLLLILDRTFLEVAQGIHKRTQTGVAFARDTLATPSKRENPLPENAERAKRAEKVAERALVAAQNRASVTKEEPLALETVAVTPPMARIWNVLNRNRLPIEDEESEPEAVVVQPLQATPAPIEDDAPTVPEPAVRVRTKQPKPKAPPNDQLTLDAVPPAPTEKPTSPLEPVVYTLPPLTLLKESPPALSKRSQEELKDRIQIIERTLEQFNIEATVMEVASGPSVTRYEVQLGPGIKVSKIVSLADNLAMSLAAIDVRVEAPIPGKAAIGVEVPNATPVTVGLRECLETEEYRNAPSKLTVALGKDVAGQYKYADLTKMPHLLIGGSTNSGKSACLNALIASLVYRATPRDVRLLMIDPKRVELSLWDGIPHLMHPVVKDVKQASGIFRAAIREMERRYDLFAALSTRNLDGYNQRVPESERLPYIVLIVDELADLMMQQGAEVETSICRLAQLARATGIHLIIATQRPSVDIITGTIKANIASRIAFAVASQIDSRTILDSPGAERLIGRGDMLFMPIDAPKPVRIQGCYLTENETNTLVEYLRKQEQPEFILHIADTEGGDGGKASSGSDDEVDQDLFEQAVRLVVNNGQASTSMLQRRFRIGYTRAARIVDMMEKRGIVGPLDGAKPREILVSKQGVEQMFNPGFIPTVDDYEEEEDEA